MADDTDTTTIDETQAPTPTPPSQPPERTFTQAEVTALLTKERQRGKRQAQRESKETQTETEEPVLANRVMQLAEQLETERKAREFLEAWASVPDASRFSVEQRQAIRDTWKEGVALTDHVSVLYPAAPPAETPPEIAPPAKPPAYSPPAAPAGAPQDAATNPLLWSKDDIARLRSQRDANGRSLFLAKLDQWADALPGGGSPFRKRIPKG